MCANPDRNTGLECLWTKHEVHVVENENDCLPAIGILKSQLKQYNVLGLHCERSKRKREVSVALLQLASYKGVVVLFHLYHFKKIPAELKEILENKHIIKVDSGNYGKLLRNDYKIKVAATLDLPLCWKRMCMEYLKIPLNNKLENKLLLRAKHWTDPKLNENQINYAAINARASIEIFKYFAKKCPQKNYLQANTVLLAIKEHCKQFNVPSFNTCNQTHRTYVYLESDDGVQMMKILRSHCHKYNILGFDCELDIISVKHDTRTAMLQLASYDGTSFFIRLYGKKLPSVSIGLQEILEDDRIVKIGISPHHDKNKLQYHGINARSMFDLRYMAEACKIQPASLPAMFRNLMEKQSVVINDDFPTNNAQVAIKLFQIFANKLEPDQSPHQGEEYVRHIVEKYCAPNFNMDFFQIEDRLKIKDMRIILDANQCSVVAEEIKRHCAEYNVLGLDCEWVRSSQVALLQLATHRGLCILVRLCFLETLPLELKEILGDANIIKVGKDVFNDAWKLYKQHDAVVTSVLDVGSMAELCGFRNGGLESMTGAFLNTPKYKTKSLSCSNWEKTELTERQINYAAKDALAGIELFTFFAEKMDISFEVGTGHVKQIIDKYFASLVKATNKWELL